MTPSVSKIGACMTLHRTPTKSSKHPRADPYVSWIKTNRHTNNIGRRRRGLITLPRIMSRHWRHNGMHVVPYRWLARHSYSPNYLTKGFYMCTDEYKTNLNAKHIHHASRSYKLEGQRRNPSHDKWTKQIESKLSINKVSNINEHYYKCISEIEIEYIDETEQLTIKSNNSKITIYQVRRNIM